MLIRARQQKQSVCWKAVGTGRKHLPWCRLSIQRRSRERPVLKGGFFCCSDGRRKQLFMKQPDSLAVAVRLVPQLESARTASRNSTLSKPARLQLNKSRVMELFLMLQSLRTWLSPSTQGLKGWNNNNPHGRHSSRGLAGVQCYCWQN